jgi:hypothetical protein
MARGVPPLEVSLEELKMSVRYWTKFVCFPAYGADGKLSDRGRQTVDVVGKSIGQSLV